MKNSFSKSSTKTGVKKNEFNSRNLVMPKLATSRQAVADAASKEDINTPSEPIEGINTPSEPIEGINTPSEPIEGINTPSEPIEGINTPSEPIEGINTPSEPKEDIKTPYTLENLRVKSHSKKTHYTTTLSEETQTYIKRMALALDANHNDIVENCIIQCFKQNEKEIIKLLRKKLL